MYVNKMKTAINPKPSTLNPEKNASVTDAPLTLCTISLI